MKRVIKQKKCIYPKNISDGNAYELFNFKSH